MISLPCFSCLTLTTPPEGACGPRVRVPTDNDLFLLIRSSAGPEFHRIMFRFAPGTPEFLDFLVLSLLFDTAAQ